MFVFNSASHLSDAPCHSERSGAATQRTKSARPGFPSRIMSETDLPKEIVRDPSHSLRMTGFEGL